MKTTIILAVLAGVTLAQDYNNSGKEETKSALSGYDWNAVMEKLGSAFRADAKKSKPVHKYYKDEQETDVYASKPHYGKKPMTKYKYEKEEDVYAEPAHVYKKPAQYGNRDVYENEYRDDEELYKPVAKKAVKYDVYDDVYADEGEVTYPIKKKASMYEEQDDQYHYKPAPKAYDLYADVYADEYPIMDQKKASMYEEQDSQYYDAPSPKKHDVYGDIYADQHEDDYQEKDEKHNNYAQKQDDSSDIYVDNSYISSDKPSLKVNALKCPTFSHCKTKEFQNLGQAIEVSSAAGTICSWKGNAVSCNLAEIGSQCTIGGRQLKKVDCAKNGQCEPAKC